jgi:hypothetical protein
MCRSLAVRYANIPRDLRDSFERHGENVLANALAAGQLSEPYPELAPLLRNNRNEIQQWLIERADLAAQRERRLYSYTRWTFWAAVAAVIVGTAALVATILSQHLMAVEDQKRAEIRAALGDFIGEGNAIFERCDDPKAAQEWIHRVEAFVRDNPSMGKSYLNRFQEVTTGVPPITPLCNLYFEMYPRLQSLRQFSQEFGPR